MSFSCLIFQNCISLHIVAGAGAPVKTKLSQPNNKNISLVFGGNFLSMNLRYFTTKCEIFCTIFFQINFERVFFYPVCLTSRAFCLDRFKSRFRIGLLLPRLLEHNKITNKIMIPPLLSFEYFSEPHSNY